MPIVTQITYVRICRLPNASLRVTTLNIRIREKTVDYGKGVHMAYGGMHVAVYGVRS